MGRSSLTAEGGGRQVKRGCVRGERAPVAGVQGGRGPGMTAMRGPMPTLARLFVTAGLLGVVARQVDLPQAGQAIAHASFPLLGLGFVALAAAFALIVPRWRLILRSETRSPGPLTLAKILWTGLFYNQILPTTIGGDAVRAWCCHKLGIGWATAIRSILLDRVCGYLVLIGLYAASLPGLLRIFSHAPQQDALVGIFAAALCGLIALIGFDLVPGGLARLPLVTPLAALSKACRRLLLDPSRMPAALGLSVLVLGFTILAFTAIGRALGCKLGLVGWSMIVPPVTLIQLLPISLAGWGVREMALVTALAAFGVPAETALAASVLFGLCQLILTLPGCLVGFGGCEVSQPGFPQLTQPGPAPGAD